jgi:hypothetical protein
MSEKLLPELLLSLLLPYAEHHESCGDHDAYNNAEVATCGCGLDALKEQSLAAIEQNARAGGEVWYRWEDMDGRTYQGAEWPNGCRNLQQIAKPAAGSGEAVALRPIESAPKDGTEIDLWHPELGRITGSQWDANLDLWTILCHQHAPTHWMPIPDAPVPAGSE